MFGFCKSNTNIPLTNLDYGFVEKCNDAKMLESILKILRSGEEGYFPDLIHFTERRLESIDPKSKLLQKESKVKMVNELQNDESKKLLDDLQEWSDTIKDVDKNLVENAHQNENNADYPPVRQQKREDQPKSQPTVTKQQPRAGKNAAPRSYSEWDKLNVESEVKKVDEVINEKKVDATRIQNKTNPIPDKVEFSEGLSEAEKGTKATIEKEKGNEAFKAGDFKEALIYYNRSISLHHSAAVYNNRAITYIKMERYEDAICDCETVLMTEPNNVKAYLRRGVALKHLKRYEKALEDFSKVLELAPSNIRARELYDDVKKNVNLEEKGQKDTTKNGSEVNEIKVNGNMKESGGEKRTFIEEMKSSPDNEMESNTGDEVLAKRKGKRLKIIEIDSADSIGKESAENGEKFDEKSGTVGELSQNGTCITNNADAVAPKNEEDFEDPPSSKRTHHPDQIDGNACEKEKSQKITSTVDGDSPSKEKNDLQDTMNSTILKNGRPDGFYVKEQNLPVPDEIIEIKNEGNEFYKAGRYPEAEVKYSEAIGKLTKEGKGHDQSIAVLLSNRAICKVKIGDCKGCVKDATESLEMWPTAKAFLRRAAAYEHLENFRNAYTDNMSALQIDNTLQAAWSATSRLSTMLMKRDGPGWREHLPKSESFSNLMQFQANYLTKSDRVVGTEREENAKPTNVESEERQNSDGAKEQSKENQNEKEIETKEDIEKNKEKFRKTKELGNKHVQNKEYKDAIDCYSECIEMFPDEVTCYTNRALCFLKLNQFKNAESDASRALAIQDDNVKALFRRALARKGSEQYEGAIKDLMSLLGIEKSNTAAKKELAAVKELELTKKKIDMKEHGNEGAKDSLKSKEDHKEAVSRPKVEEGKGLKLQGETAGMEENGKLNEIKEEKKKGKKMKIIEVENYDEIEAITGRQSGNDYVEGISCCEMKEKEKSNEGKMDMGKETCDEKCGKETGDVEGRDKPTKPGRVELKDEKLQTANVLTEGRKKGERGKDNERSSNGKQKDKKIESMEEKFNRIKESGNRCVQEGKYEEAIKHYSQCIVLNANEPVPFVNRAICYLKLNKPKKAESDCSKALNLQPNNKKALFQRAMARKAIEKYKDALQDLSAFLKLDPKNTSAQRELETIKELWRKELKSIAKTESEKSSESSATLTQKSKKKRPENAEIKEKQTPSVNEAAKAEIKDPCDGTSECCSTTKENFQRSSKKLNLKKATGFEFLKAWNELKGKNLSDYASLLSQIEPSQLPKVISNKIDAEMILIIVSCVSEYFFTKNKLVFGFNVLKYASKSERFDMGLMFLSTNDLSKVRTVIEEIASKLKDAKIRVSAKDILELRKAYKAT